MHFVDKALSSEISEIGIFTLSLYVLKKQLSNINEKWVKTNQIGQNNEKGVQRGSNSI